MNEPLNALRHHVTGAIERGEAEAIVEKRAPKYIAIYLDCCLSGYFQGFDGLVLNVPVDNETTYGELCGDLVRELQVYDAGYYEASLGEPFDWEAAEKAIIDLFNVACVGNKVTEAKYASRYPPEHDWRVAVSKEETKLGYDDWKEGEVERMETCYFYIGFRKGE